MKLFKKMIEQKGKKGFTLVEMLIVIALLSILMCVAVPGVSGYAKRLQLIELDDSARAIFMSVQNKMTVMKQAGIDADDMTFAGSAPLTENDYIKVTNPEGVLEDTVKNADGSETTTSIENLKLLYVDSDSLKTLSNSGSSSFVQLGNSGESIEGQILKHDFIVEYEAETGTVLSVFYSEEGGLASYYANTMSCYGDQGSREFETRLAADKLVGYYGAEADLQNLVNVVQKPGGIVETTPVGGSTSEKLAIEVKLPDDCEDDEYYFQFELIGKDANGREHTIQIVPYSDSVKYTLKKRTKATIVLDSIAPGLSADNGQWNLPSDKDMSGYVLERDFRGWVYVSNEYLSEGNSIFSDRANGQYKGDIEYDPYINGPSSWEYYGLNYPCDFSNPMLSGGYYAIDPGSDIRYCITYYDKNGVKLSDSFTSDLMSSYFGAPLNGSMEAKLSAGRHLQNLANVVHDKLISSARLLTDIDFSKDSGNYEHWNSEYTNKGTNANPWLYNFLPICSDILTNNATIQYINGDGHEIKYLRIDTTAADPRTIINSTDPDQVKKKKEKFKENTGFFSYLYDCTFGNLTFYCPVVKGGGENTGVVFGSTNAGAHFINFEIINPIVEGAKYVGALCGTLGGGTGPENIKVYVKETTGQSSMVAEVETDGHFNNYGSTPAERTVGAHIVWGDTETDPYQHFYIKGTTVNSYAGGLVGYTKSFIKNSAAAIRIESEGYAGGLVGKSSAEITDCYVGGHTNKGKFVRTNGEPLINIEGEKGAGGLVGEMAGGRANKCYTTCSVGKGTNGDNYDVFVGNATSFSGQEPAYAIGSLIDIASKTVVKNASGEERSKWSGVKNLEEVIKYTDKYKPSSSEAQPYDSSLKGQKYPYYSDASHATPDTHIGDWPSADVGGVKYGVFYWEKEDGKYQFKILGKYQFKILGKSVDESGTLTELSDDTLCKLYDGNAISEYGYGYFYTTSSDTVIVNGIEGASEDDSIKSAFPINNVKVFSKRYDTGEGERTVSLNGAVGETSINATFIINTDFCAMGETDITEYQIRTEKQLANIAKDGNLNKAYIQTHDIATNGNMEIAPIGDKTKPFTGKYDGNGYRIVKLYVKTNTKRCLGLFGTTSGATLSNIVVFNGTVGDNCSLTDGYRYVGGIVGYAENTTITGCAFTGKVSPTSNNNQFIAVGGIAGGLSGGSISNCEAVADISCSGNSNGGDVVYIAGLVGVTNVSISGCYTGGKLEKNPWFDPEKYYISGIANAITGGSDITISSCYTYSSFTSDYPIGVRVSGTGGLHFNKCCVLNTSDAYVGTHDDTGVTRYQNFNDFATKTMSLEGITNAYNNDWTVVFKETNLTKSYSYPCAAVLRLEGAPVHYGATPSASQTTQPGEEGSGEGDDDEIDVDEGKFTITVVSSEGGVVEVSKYKADEGKQITFTITPDERHKINNVYIKNQYTQGVSYSEENGQYTFIMPGLNVTIYVEFDDIIMLSDPSVDIKLDETGFVEKYICDYPYSEALRAVTSVGNVYCKVNLSGYRFVNYGIVIPGGANISDFKVMIKNNWESVYNQIQLGSEYGSTVIKPTELSNCRFYIVGGVNSGGSIRLYYKGILIQEITAR